MNTARVLSALFAHYHISMQQVQCTLGTHSDIYAARRLRAEIGNQPSDMNDDEHIIRQVPRSMLSVYIANHTDGKSIAGTSTII